ncbi:hypothetical protein D9M71_202450 [compost metagenome]
MIDTVTDAPGEAPSRAAMVPSSADTSSVPNCRMPPFFGSFLMICTRWPAVSRRQSSVFACG